MKEVFERKGIISVGRWYLALVAGAVSVAWFASSPGVAISLLCGAGIGALNFFLIYRNCQAIFLGAAGGERNGTVVAALGFCLRFGMLLLVVAVSIYIGAHPVGLVIGLSLIVPAILIQTWISRPAVDRAATLAPLDDGCREIWNASLVREEITEEDRA